MAESMVIVGGSIAVLATALALSRMGQEVVVLEQDAPPPPGSPQELFTTWKRRGVPQLRHSHGFLARLRNLLRDRYPDLLEALLAEGAQEQTIGGSLPPVLAPAYQPTPGDDDLTSLLCRRTTFERVLHAYVSEQPRVSLQPGVKVRGVRHARDHAVPRLTGLTVQQDETHQEMVTETIIDATGRLSPFPAWLRDIGVELLEDQHDTGIVYYTRYYRLLDGVEAPKRTNHSSMGDLGYLKFGVFPGDQQTFSLTLAIPTVETDLRILNNNDVFDQVCQRLPSPRGSIQRVRNRPPTCLSWAVCAVLTGNSWSTTSPWYRVFSRLAKRPSTPIHSTVEAAHSAFCTPTCSPMPSLPTPMQPRASNTFTAPLNISCYRFTSPPLSAMPPVCVARNSRWLDRAHPGGASTSCARSCNMASPLRCAAISTYVGHSCGIFTCWICRMWRSGGRVSSCVFCGSGCAANDAMHTYIPPVRVPAEGRCAACWVWRSERCLSSSVLCRRLTQGLISPYSAIVDRR